MANTREGQGYLTSSPCVSSVPKKLNLWALHSSAHVQQLWILSCFRQQEICFNPFHSHDFTAPAGKPSGKVAMLQSLFREQGGVSREGNRSQRFCNAQNAESHIPVPLLQDTRCWWQALCTWGGFPHKDGLGLLKSNPQRGSVPLMAPYHDTTNPSQIHYLAFCAQRLRKGDFQKLEINVKYCYVTWWTSFLMRKSTYCNLPSVWDTLSLHRGAA